MRSLFHRYTGIAVAVALTALLPAIPALADPAAGNSPGTVVSYSPMPASKIPPGMVDASLVTYWSTGPLNQPSTSTGAIFVPPGEPPAGGWPVVSWAHGTEGVADKCAPTVTGRMIGPYIRHWFDQGYAIVATDYIGLGTPGVHPYLDGPSEAHSVIDMVRAARAVEPSLSDKWVAIGQSQGGHATLAAAAIATKYAPELDFRGAVATGAPSNLEHLAPLAGPGFPELPLVGSTLFIAYALTGLRAARPDLELNQYLSPLGIEVLDRVETQCYAEAAPQLQGVSIGDLLSRPLGEPRLLDAIRQMLGIPTQGYERPLFIGQGLLDEMVPAPFAFALAAEMAANRQKFVFETYPTGHIATMAASVPDSTPFVKSLFAEP